LYFDSIKLFNLHQYNSVLTSLMKQSPFSGFYWYQILMVLLLRTVHLRLIIRTCSLPCSVSGEWKVLLLLLDLLCLDWTGLNAPYLCNCLFLNTHHSKTRTKPKVSSTRLMRVVRDYSVFNVI